MGFSESTLSTQHLRDVNFGNLMRIAVPIMLSQATETIMMFTDRLFLSRLGSGYLGVAMSGGLSSFVFSSLFIGTLGYLAAVTSQHFGAGKNEQAVRYVPQGVWLALAAYPLALLSQPLARLIFVLSGHTETQVELEFSYFSVLMYGSVFVF
ncbi:MAG: hypothetical protein EHM28_11935 [Spirochaetaceae bacterium]|nr:MAG: hypothetical protein EHM28_11935 [Spirochaetaceae bacterium]